MKDVALAKDLRTKAVSLRKSKLTLVISDKIKERCTMFVKFYYPLMSPPVVLDITVPL